MFVVVDGKLDCGFFVMFVKGKWFYNFDEFGNLFFVFGLENSGGFDIVFYGGEV